MVDSSPSEFRPRPVSASEAQGGANPATDHGIAIPDPRPDTQPGKVVVTGASTGIGWDTVVNLQKQGWQVIATARRAERLAHLAALTGCAAFAADLSQAEHVQALVEYATAEGPVWAVVNNAGGALGTESVAEADPQKWIDMYQRNVMTALRVSQAFLPHLRENGGDLVFVTSTAAYETYPGGAGYTAAKHAEAMLPQTLRMELVGEPVRVIEICPGLVQTPEFTLTRTGDKAAAEALYASVEMPLSGYDIAQAITWTLTRPEHVVIDRMIIRPVEQATANLKRRLGS